MTNQVFINWVLGILSSLTVATIVGCAKGFIHLRDEVKAIKTTLSMMSESAARALHSPDDHLGLDKYLDKYLDHDCDMSYAEWDEFKRLLIGIREDKDRSAGERTAAGFLLALAYHKLAGPMPDKTFFRVKE